MGKRSGSAGQADTSEWWCWPCGTWLVCRRCWTAKKRLGRVPLGCEREIRRSSQIGDYFEHPGNPRSDKVRLDTREAGIVCSRFHDLLPPRSRCYRWKGEDRKWKKINCKPEARKNPLNLNFSQTYPGHGEWKRAIEIAETFDTETVECLMSHITNFSPNSYTFTKALAEDICEDYRNQIPITIVRLSIVTGTECEPIPGWCDNFNGPVGLLTACGLGIMRSMYASHKAELNCVAVDVVARTLICAGWKCAIDNAKKNSRDGKESNEFRNDRQLSVYNCASLHNMTLEFLVYDGQYMVRQYPFEKAVWLPGGGVTLCHFMNYFRVSFNFALLTRDKSRMGRECMSNGKLQSAGPRGVKEI